MRIRPYSPDDLEPVLALWRRTSLATYTFFRNPDPHTAEEDRGYFTSVITTQNDLWIAESSDGILGYLAIKDGFIDRLYVAVDRQREGVGSALLEHAKALSPGGLRLFTHQGNVGACGFYEAHGFEALKYGVSPPPESEPDIEYGWKPTAS